jgi:protein-S-isoprenylcysteine O-methyltransferase Ste14
VRDREWLWKNVPVPEIHVAFLIFGTVLSLVKPHRIGSTRSRYLFGLPLMAVGLALAAWATRAAGETELDRPQLIVTSGPYARSRHPMYVAWTLLYAGLAAAFNAAWLWTFLPLVLVLVHREALREEARLVSVFGSTYESYRATVRRYL